MKRRGRMVWRVCPPDLSHTDGIPQSETVCGSFPWLPVWAYHWPVSLCMFVSLYVFSSVLTLFFHRKVLAVGLLWPCGASVSLRQWQWWHFARGKPFLANAGHYSHLWLVASVFQTLWLISSLSPQWPSPLWFATNSAFTFLIKKYLKRNRSPAVRLPPGTSTTMLPRSLPTWWHFSSRWLETIVPPMSLFFTSLPHFSPPYWPAFMAIDRFEQSNIWQSFSWKVGQSRFESFSGLALSVYSVASFSPQSEPFNSVASGTHFSTNTNYD